MIPTFQEETLVFVKRKWFFCTIRIGDVIILHDPRTKRTIIKRVIRIENIRYFVQGDNNTESTDSNAFGWVSKKDIIGKVIYSLKKSK